jgi:CHAT domain-containing protein/Tfp pilus assembly protein PilF
MPTAQPRYRSALAALLIFPWFALPSFEAQAPVLPGVVIEEIPKGSALEKAGLQVGDVILTWERLPNPPANPEGASGKLDNPFDWMWVEIEQAPRGTLRLKGEREEERFDVLMLAGAQGVVVRPRLSRNAAQLYQAASRAATGSDSDSEREGWRRLEEAARAAEDDTLQTWLSFRIADKLNKQHAWGAAAKVLSERIPQIHEGGVRVRLLDLLSDLLLEHGKLNEAEEAANSALETRREVWADSLELARGQERLGAIAWSRRDIGKATSLLEISRDIRRRLAPLSVDYARSLNNLSGLYIYEGRLDEADAALKEGTDIVESCAPGTRLLANFLNNRGLAYYRRGQLDRAESDHSRALEIREKLEPGTFNHASSLNNLGIVLADRGDLDRADYYLRSSLEIKNALGLSDLETAMTLNNLGTLATERGFLVEAEWYHRQALAIRQREAPGTMDEAMSLANLAGLLTGKETDKEAFALLEKSIKIYRKIAPQSTELAAALNNIAGRSMSRGELSGVQGLLSEALETVGGSKADSLLASSIIRSLGIYEERRGSLSEAEEMYRKSLAIRQKRAPATLAEAEALSTLGMLLWKRGDKAGARELVRQAVQAFDLPIDGPRISRGLSDHFREQHRRVFLDAVEVELDSGNPGQALLLQEIYREEAFRAMLAGKDDVLVGELSAGLQARRRAAFDKYESFLRQNSLPDSSELNEAMMTAVEGLRSELRDISVESARSSSRRANLERWRNLRLEDLGTEVEEGTLELVYVAGYRGINVFVLKKGEELRVIRIPVSVEQVRGWLRRLRSLLPEAVGVVGDRLGRTQRLRSLLAEIYKKLLAPSLLSTEPSRLLIIPDGPLHYLPWGALIRDFGEKGMTKQQYLAEWKPFSISPSETLFAELKKKRRPIVFDKVDAKDPTQVPEFIGFGAPTYPSGLDNVKPEAISDARARAVMQRGMLSLEPLPWSQREVEDIANLFPPGHAQVFVGGESTEEEVKKVAQGVRILHFATHARLDNLFPLNSALVLTMPEGLPPDRDNGLLQVWEIFEKMRLDADLVVLSACDSALGEEEGGEGLVGLTRAFQYAGARSVMASLWSVQDQATSELMIRFYKHLRAGLTKDEALRQAQIELIRTPIEVVNEKGEKSLFDASAPYFWAGFQVYGDWQ